jgi:hypothetical protein
MDILNTRETAVTLHGSWYASGEGIYPQELDDGLWRTFAKSIPEGGSALIWFNLRAYTAEDVVTLLRDGIKTLCIPGGPLLVLLCREGENTYIMARIYSEEESAALENHAILFGDERQTD